MVGLAPSSLEGWRLSLLLPLAPWDGALLAALILLALYWRALVGTGGHWV